MRAKKIRRMIWVSLLWLLVMAGQAFAAPTISAKSLVLHVGETYTLKVKGGSGIKWSTSKKTVATISQKGKVKGIRIGSAKITAKVGKKKLTCKVIVRAKAASAAKAASGTKAAAAGSTKVTNSNAGKITSSGLSGEELRNFNMMVGFRKVYPEGMTFTNDDYYQWKGGIYRGGYGCAGFCFELSDACFGSERARMFLPISAFISAFGSLQGLRPGDILRVDNNTHSVIVLNQDTGGGAVIVAEANYNKSVHWGRRIPYSEILSTGTNVMTRYTTGYLSSQVYAMSAPGFDPLKLPDLDGTGKEEEESWEQTGEIQEKAEESHKQAGVIHDKAEEKQERAEDRASQDSEKSGQAAKVKEEPGKDKAAERANIVEIVEKKNAETGLGDITSGEMTTAETDPEESASEETAGQEATDGEMAAADMDSGERPPTETESEVPEEAPPEDIPLAETPAEEMTPAETPLKETMLEEAPEKSADEPLSQEREDVGEVALTVSVVWNDEENAAGKRPQQVKVMLYELGGIDLGSGSEAMNPGSSYLGFVTLGPDNWSRTVYVSAAPDAAFQWLEETPAGYSVSYALSQGELHPGSSSTTITNTYVGDTGQTVDHTLHIRWDDEEDVLGIRPQSVTVPLSNGMSAELSAANGWSAVLADLPVFDGETRLEHSWMPPTLEGYVLSEMEIEGTETTLVYKALIEYVYEKVKLKIKYLLDGEPIAETYVAILEEGEAYNVRSPKIAGYTPDKVRVKGVIRANTTIRVHYTAQRHTVTIRYRSTDGRELAQVYTADYKAGESFAVDTPQVAGYTADQASVSGTVAGLDLEYVVYYHPTPQPAQGDGQSAGQSGQGSGQGASEDQGAETGSGDNSGDGTADGTEITIEEYETPLGLGNVTINGGECFE